jgi:hypothetical protein
MSITKESINIFSIFFRTIQKIISIILTTIFAVYIILLIIVYVLQFLTWEPIIQVAHISPVSVQKFQRYESKLINTFVYLPQKSSKK